MGDDVWAWIAENSDEQDGLYASARFRAHVEVGDDLGEQLDDASLKRRFGGHGSGRTLF